MPSLQTIQEFFARRKPAGLPLYMPKNPMEPLSATNCPDSEYQQNGWIYGYRRRNPIFTMKYIFTSTHEQEKWNAENPSPYRSLESGDARQAKTQQQRGARGTSAASLDAFLHSIHYCVRRVFKEVTKRKFDLGSPATLLLLMAVIVLTYHILVLGTRVFNSFAS